MKEFLESFIKSLNDFLGSTNSAIEALPPIEQAETADSLGWIFTCLKNFVEDTKSRIAALETEMKGKVEEAQSMFEKQSAESLDTAKAKLLEDGEYISKTDHEAALEAAVTSAKEEAQTEFQSTLDREKHRSERQSSLNELTPEGVTVTFSEDILDLEDAAFTLAKSKIEDRLGQLKEKGITAAGAVTEVCSMPVDGDEEFDKKLGWWMELGKGATSHQSAPKPKSSDSPETETEGDLMMV